MHSCCPRVWHLKSSTRRGLHDAYPSCAVYEHLRLLERALRRLLVQIPRSSASCSTSPEARKSCPSQVFFVFLGRQALPWAARASPRVPTATVAVLAATSSRCAHPRVGSRLSALAASYSRYARVHPVPAPLSVWRVHTRCACCIPTAVGSSVTLRSRRCPFAARSPVWSSLSSLCVRTLA